MQRQNCPVRRKDFKEAGRRAATCHFTRCRRADCGGVAPRVAPPSASVRPSARPWYMNMIEGIALARLSRPDV